MNQTYPPLPRVPDNEGGRGKPFPNRKMVALSWPEEDRQVWEDFQAAMKRDGWTAAELIRFWVRSYLSDHPLGNPQTPLERFKEPPKPAPSPVRDWRKMSKREEYEFKKLYPMLYEKTRK